MRRNFQSTAVLAGALPVAGAKTAASGPNRTYGMFPSALVTSALPSAPHRDFVIRPLHGRKRAAKLTWISKIQVRHLAAALAGGRGRRGGGGGGGGPGGRGRGGARWPEIRALGSGTTANW